MNNAEYGRIAMIKRLPPEIIQEKLERVKRIFIGIPIFKTKGDYPYSIFTLTDYSPPMVPDLMEDMADLIVHAGNFSNADLILSEGDRGGGPLTHAVSLRTGLPYTLANWYKDEVPGAINVAASVGFSGDGYICVNGIKPGQKVNIVDDLLSSGGTSCGLIEAVQKSGATVNELLFVGEKVNLGGRQKIRDRFGDVKVTSLVKFKSEGKVTEEAL
jgi:adenine phosphoribosyltransferase